MATLVATICRFRGTGAECPPMRYPPHGPPSHPNLVDEPLPGCKAPKLARGQVSRRKRYHEALSFGEPLDDDGPRTRPTLARVAWLERPLK